MVRACAGWPLQRRLRRVARGPSLLIGRRPRAPLPSNSLQAGEEGYAFSLTTFSPSGKLLQIEHALKAVSVGKTSLGIQGAWYCCLLWPLCLVVVLTCLAFDAATNGVVLATERKAPSILVDEDTMEKVAFITNSIGALLHVVSCRQLLSATRPLSQALYTRAWARTFGCSSRRGRRRRRRTSSPTGCDEVSRPGERLAARPPRRPRPCAQEDIPVLELVREIATVMQEFTQSGGVRPFGVSLLVAG